MLRGRPAATALTIGAVTALLLTASTPVSAQVRVGVVAIDIEDEAPPEARPELLEALAAGLRPSASTVSALEGVDVSEQACVDDAACRQRAARQVGAQALLRARFGQLGQLYEIVVELLDADEGASLGQVRSTCEVCTLSEAIDGVRQAAQGLSASLPGLLELTLTPEDAEVSLDGRAVDAGQPLVLSPGDHQLRASAPGHLEQTREVQIVAGARSALTLALQPGEAPTRGPATPRGAGQSNAYAIWGWITAGGAVAALLPGIIWLALEGECAIGSAYQDGLCVDIYYTWPQGLAVTLVGAGLLAAAIPLLILNRRRRETTTTAAPTLSLLDGGATFGLVGRF